MPGQPSLVYIQNLGFGNSITPLFSLTDAKVDCVPMLVMLGLRGESGVTELGKKPSGYEDIQGQYTGLIKVRADMLKPLAIFYKSLTQNPIYQGTKGKA